MLFAKSFSRIFGVVRAAPPRIPLRPLFEGIYCPYRKSNRGDSSSIAFCPMDSAPRVPVVGPSLGGGAGRIEFLTFGLAGMVPAVKVVGK